MNFKTMFITVCVALGLQTCGFAQQISNYEISGKIPGAHKILLAADPYSDVILDSAENADGSFVFKGTAKNVALGSIIAESKKYMFTRYYPIYVEAGKIKVKLYEGGRQAEIRGSQNNDIMSTVESQNKNFWYKVSSLYDTLNYASMKMHDLRKSEMVDKDSIASYEAQQARIEKTAAPLIAARNERLKLAFKKYPNTYFTAYNALNLGVIPEEELKKMYAAFPENIKKSSIGKEWKDQLFKTKRLVAGAAAPEFAVADMNGKMTKLSDFRGKYVLLDFWATWCGPCRAGNPHLISLYKQYKDQGLEFIGISDDDTNVTGWKKAVNDDGIGIWLQVLRSRDKQNSDGTSLDIARAYEVNSYPTKILIDKEGKIVRIFGDDQEMEELFKEIFKKS